MNRRKRKRLLETWLPLGRVPAIGLPVWLDKSGWVLTLVAMLSMAAFIVNLVVYAQYFLRQAKRLEKWFGVMVLAICAGFGLVMIVSLFGR